MLPIALAAILLSACWKVDIFDGASRPLEALRFYGVYADSGTRIAVLEEVYGQTCPSLLSTMGSCDTNGTGTRFRIYSTTLADPSNRKGMVGWTETNGLWGDGPQVFHLSTVHDRLIYSLHDGRYGTRKIVLAKASGGSPKVLTDLPRLLGEDWFVAVPSPDFRTLAVVTYGGARHPGGWTGDGTQRILLLDLATRRIRDSVVMEQDIWMGLLMRGRTIAWEDDSSFIYYAFMNRPDTGKVGYRIRGTRVTDTLLEVGCVARPTTSTFMDGKGKYLAFDSGLVVARDFPAGLDSCVGIR